MHDTPVSLCSTYEFPEASCQTKVHACVEGSTESALSTSRNAVSFIEHARETRGTMLSGSITQAVKGFEYGVDWDILLV